MVKLIAKRAVKGKSKKRASTYAEKMYRLSANQLLELLATSPDTIRSPSGEIEKSPIKILARRYLNIIYNMSNEKIDIHIKKKKDRNARFRDVGKYYRGEKSPEEVAMTWAPIREGYSPQSVHSDAKRIFKFEIPAGQKPLIASNPVLHKIYELNRAARAGKIPYEILSNYLLDLAYERPEFAANIAHILFTDKPDNYVFRGKAGDALRREFENIITERAIEFNRKNPNWAHKGISPRISIAEEDMEMSKKTSPGYDDVIYSKDMYDNERKKKKARVITKRKSRRVIKIRKPVKKCRCK